MPSKFNMKLFDVIDDDEKHKKDRRCGKKQFVDGRAEMLKRIAQVLDGKNPNDVQDETQKPEKKKANKFKVNKPPKNDENNEGDINGVENCNKTGGKVITNKSTEVSKALSVLLKNMNPDIIKPKRIRKEMSQEAKQACYERLMQGKARKAELRLQQLKNGGDVKNEVKPEKTENIETVKIDNDTNPISKPVAKIVEKVNDKIENIKPAKSIVAKVSDKIIQKPVEPVKPVEPAKPVKTSSNPYGDFYMPNFSKKVNLF